MIIHRVAVSNYRIHRQLEVQFDSRCTLVGGPNESGKSTLAEAIHRALFLRAKTGGELQAEMRSVLFPGTPTVMLEFSTSGRRFILTKVYAGNRGSARLQDLEGTNWLNDAAEEKLVEILGSEAQHAGRITTDKLKGAWQHLWVVQGSADHAPTELAAARQDDLVPALQQEGGVAVVQSHGDRVVAELVTKACDATWLANRKGVKKDTRVARLHSMRADARKRLADAEAAWQRLADAVQQLERAGEVLADGKVERLEGELKDATAGLTLQQELEGKREACAARQGEAIGAQMQLQDEHQRLEAAEREEAQLTAELQELTGKRLALREAAEERLRHVHEADDGIATLWTRSEQARQRRDLIALELRRMQVHDDLQRVGIELQQAEDLQASQVTVSSALGALALVDEAGVEQLRALQTAVLLAAKELETLGVRLELGQHGQSVRLDGRLLEVGVPVRLDAAGTLSLDDGTTVHITPGGARSLAQAREHHAERHRLFTVALQEAGVPSVEAAAEVLQQRQRLMVQRHSLEEQLTRLSPATQKERRGKLEVEQSELLARRDRLAAGEPIPAVEGDQLAEAARGAEQVAADLARDLKIEEDRRALLKEEADRQQEALALCEQEATKREVVLAGKRGALERDRATAGDSDGRARRRTEAAGKVAAIGEELSRLNAELEPLQAQGLGGVVSRLTRALAGAREERERAQHTRIEAETLLRRDGASDPLEGLASARAALERTERQHAHEQARAEATRLLKALLDEAGRQLSQEYLRPLQRAVERYLAPVLGPGVQVRLTEGDDSAFGQLTVTRPSLGGMAVAFHELSVGTKEQVAVAFRLAMADVLARERGEPLPVVLDDAFANADPQRVKALRSMLDLAVQGGQLQVLVLSCTPRDYEGLGGLEVMLPRPQVTAGGMAIAASAAGDEEEDGDLADDGERPGGADRQATPVAPVADGHAEEFLAALERRGGTSGNKGLRDALGWDEERYDAVRDALVAEGRVQKGQGRGGSVRVR